MINGICSRCLEDFYTCQCEYFHPNLNQRIDFSLSKDEVSELLKFFMNVGYIDYEAFEKTHKIIKRMNRFVQW